MFKCLEEKKKLIEQKRPIPFHTLESIRQHLLLEWTYNSNAIEGNTLTLSETKVVLENGITIGGKTLREHLEVINHREAIFFVEDIVKRNEPLTEWQIKSIHQLVLKGIDDQNAGRYRQENVIISGAKHISPDFIDVPTQMENLIKYYYEELTKLHPIERAAKLHSLFVNIHPFVDGNGRTARLLMNLELMKADWFPVIIETKERHRYYDALDLAATANDYSKFVDIVAETTERILDLYLRLLK